LHAGKDDLDQGASVLQRRAAVRNKPLAARPARALIRWSPRTGTPMRAAVRKAGDLLILNGEVVMNRTLRSTRAVLAFAALTLLACVPSGEPAARSAGQQETEAAVIRELSRQWGEAMRRQDVSALLTMYTADAAIYEPGLPPITAADGLRQHFEELATLEIISIDDEIRDIEVASSGDLAVETGYSRWEWRDAAGQHVERGPYIVVWRKQDGTWRVAREIFNSDQPQAPRAVLQANPSP
jgi:ketosteroid isomerase-like protein